MTKTTGMTGVGVWSTGLRWGDPVEASESAAELEELGYTALWIPDIGGAIFDDVDRLLGSTKRVTLATGVLNLWMHSAEETAAGYVRVTDAHGPRFLVGIGVSHASVVAQVAKPGLYTKPLSAMSAFLDGLDAAPAPLPKSARVLAALGPKMLELARDRAAGTHPYNVTPMHTAQAREAVGPDGLVLPEQAVVFTTDPAEGRRIGREHLMSYLEAMPNYVNNLRRQGFGDDDFADGGSNKLIDAVVAWGDEDAIRARVREHFDAGADHVCIQVLGEGDFPRDTWRALAAALVG
jgi:probable F420-dependent oxidoreductase